MNHAELVKALVKPGEEIINELTAYDAHLIHMVLGISGEAGELVDAIKKSTLYRKPVDIENIIEELGDIEFYMEGLRQALCLTREHCLEANINKLSKRYSGGSFSNAAAQQRADKEDDSRPA